MRNPLKRFQPARGARPLNPRQRVLASWRGTDLTQAEGAARDTAKPAAAFVSGLLKNLRMEQRRTEAEIVNVWNKLMDPSVVAHAQPAGIHRGTLFVNVDSNVWLYEILRYRRQEILTRLQHSFGAELIKRVSYRVS